MKLSHVRKLAWWFYKIANVCQLESGLYVGLSNHKYNPDFTDVYYSKGIRWYKVFHAYKQGKGEDQYILFRLGMDWYKMNAFSKKHSLGCITIIGEGVETVHGDDEFFQWTFPGNHTYEFWIDGATNSLAVIGSPQKGLVEISDEVRLDEDDGVDTLLNILKQKAKDAETTEQIDSSSASQQEDKENENGKAI
jgi:hypothetical protein